MTRYPGTRAEQQEMGFRMGLVHGCVLLFALSGTLVGCFPRWQVEQEAHDFMEPFSLLNPAAVRIFDFESQKLQASPSVLSYSGEAVTVTWDGLPPAASQHWVGVYLVSDDVTKTVPMRYQMIKTAQQRSLSFKVMNMREDVVFYLFSGTLDQPLVLGRSNVVMVANKKFPTGGRLALTNNSSRIKVTWTSVWMEPKQQVLYGTTKGKPDRIATADEVVSYKRGDMCGGAATTVGYRDPGQSVVCLAVSAWRRPH